MSLNKLLGRRCTPVVAACALALLAAIAGCHSDTKLNAKDEAVARSTAERKGPLTLNDVPPEQRDKVRAMMQANGARPPSQRK